MKIISWNCQCRCAPLTKDRLKELCLKVSPDILYLIETMNKNDVVRDVVVTLGFDYTCLVPPRGRSGGLAVLWKKDVVVTKLYESPRLIDLYVQYNGLNFYLSCVYGDPKQQYRHVLWERIQRIGVSRNGPWLLVGDFNEILNNTEKDGGVVRDESSFQDFRDLYVTCDLRDLRSIGDKFSWVGTRNTHVIKCCLDRVVANSEWLSLYPASEAEFLKLSGSDHRPVVTTVSFLNQRYQKPFRFDKRLFKVKDFKTYVESGWNSLSGGRQISIGKKVAV